MSKAWSGRFSQPTDKLVEAFTESISFDARLADVDIRGSRAHARMLSEVGLISADEFQAIDRELEAIGQMIGRGEMTFSSELEDIHLHIESELIRRLGDTGRKLHTGRSRNDQVSTDLKLYTRDAIDQVDQLLEAVQRAFVGRGDADLDIIIPGYTHLQRAQPVAAPHYWLAYVEKFQRDRDRLADCRRRVNISPLGAAALAGSSLPIDRHRTAALLGFAAPAANSLDVSSDRDYLVEFTNSLALIAAHLSTWAEEWILWNTTEFGFLRLPDAFTTGSSIMPQKKNPDVLELIRGKSSRVIGAAQTLLVLIKGLPMAYNRDLQDDKRAMFDAYDAVAACLTVAPQIISGAELRRDVIASRIDDGFLDATALMEYLIQRGIPMRTGHEVVGRLVAECEQRKCRLQDLSLMEIRTLVPTSAAPLIDESVSEVLGSANAAAALISYGSGSRVRVAEQLAEWKKRLAE